MQENLGGNIEVLAQLKSTIGIMDKEQKEQFKSLLKEANLVSKEDFSRDMASFLNTLEAEQILIICMKIGKTLETNYELPAKNSEGTFNLETKFGNMKLSNKDFLELDFSTIVLTRKLLGNDISFPQKTPPKIFREMAEDHNALIEDKNEFHLHALIGEAKIKVFEDKCTVFISTQALLRDFLARLYLNLRLNDKNTE